MTAILDLLKFGGYRRFELGPTTKFEIIYSI